MFLTPPVNKDELHLYSAHNYLTGECDNNNNCKNNHLLKAS